MGRARIYETMKEMLRHEVMEKTKLRSDEYDEFDRSIHKTAWGMFSHRRPDTCASWLVYEVIADLSGPSGDSKTWIGTRLAVVASRCYYIVRVATRFAVITTSGYSHEAWIAISHIKNTLPERSQMGQQLR